MHFDKFSALVWINNVKTKLHTRREEEIQKNNHQLCNVCSRKHRQISFGVVGQINLMQLHILNDINSPLENSKFVETEEKIKKTTLINATYTWSSKVRNLLQFPSLLKIFVLRHGLRKNEKTFVLAFKSRLHHHHLNRYLSNNIFWLEKLENCAFVSFRFGFIFIDRNVSLLSDFFYTFLNARISVSVRRLLL